MADKAGLIAALTAIYTDLTGKTAAQKAQETADAIDDFVKSGTVDSTVSIPSTGAPTTPSTGTATGSWT